jgi:hypothetical protein
VATTVTPFFSFSFLEECGMASGGWSYRRIYCHVLWPNCFGDTTADYTHSKKIREKEKRTFFSFLQSAGWSQLRPSAAAPLRVFWPVSTRVTESQTVRLRFFRYYSLPDFCSWSTNGTS